MGNFSFGKGNSVSINGRTINVPAGKSISIVNNEIWVDGRPASFDGFEDTKVFNIVIHGDVENISGEVASVTVHGNAGSVSTMSGDAIIEGDVNGNVKTMSGDVKVKGNVTGNVKSMSGDIRR